MSLHKETAQLAVARTGCLSGGGNWRIPHPSLRDGNMHHLSHLEFMLAAPKPVLLQSRGCVMNLRRSSLLAGSRFCAVRACRLRKRTCQRSWPGCCSCKMRAVSPRWIQPYISCLLGMGCLCTRSMVISSAVRTDVRQNFLILPCQCAGTAICIASIGGNLRIAGNGAVNRENGRSISLPSAMMITMEILKRKASLIVFALINELV